MLQLDSKLRKAQVQAGLFETEPIEIKIGRYTLVERVGSGSMGEVYLAFDRELERKVAIKLVRSNYNVASQADERLIREARVLARLSNANVVQIHDVDIYEGRVFIAMEFVSGQTMEKWIATLAERFPRASVRHRHILQRYLQAGRGLHAAHEAGLAHRDFKPSNILVGNDGCTKVADFGLARVQQTRENGLNELNELNELDGMDSQGSQVDAERSLARTYPTAAHRRIDATARGLPEASEHTATGPGSLASLTVTGTFLGTPAYMAPEVLHGQSADHRSDQFSFCVSLFEALNGVRPFVGDDIEALKDAIEHGAISSWHPAVPTYVRRVLRRGLASIPEERYEDMAHLLAALENRARARRQRLWVAAIGTAAIAVASVALLSERPESTPEAAAQTACVAAEQELATVWNDQRRTALRRQIHHAANPHTSRTWRELLEPAIDRYGTAWIAGHRTACTDNQIGRLSDESFEQRLQCLNFRKSGLSHTLEFALSREISKSGLDDLVKAFANLPDVADCADLKVLTAKVAIPGGEAARAQVKLQSERLEDASLYYQTGRYEDALDVALQVRREAESLGYQPLLVEALLLEGQSAKGLDSSDQASTAFTRAMELALSENMAAAATEAFTRLLYTGGISGAATDNLLSQATIMENIVRALPTGTLVYSDWLRRQYRRDSIHPAMLNNLGVALRADDRPDEAREYFERALELINASSARVQPPLEVLHIQFNTAMFTHKPGSMEQALTRIEQLLGVWHPISLKRRKLLSHFTADARRALAILEPACASYREHHPDRPADLLHCLYHLAFLTALSGDETRAASHLQELAGHQFATHKDQTISELARGYADLFRGDLDDARVQFSATLDRFPDRPKYSWQHKMPTDAYLGLGLVEQRLGHAATAKEQLQRALAGYQTLIEHNARNTEYRQRLNWTRRALDRLGER